MRKPENSNHVVDNVRYRSTVGKGITKRVLVLTLSGALLVQPITASSILWGGNAPIAAAQAVTSPDLKLVKEEMLTAGAKRIDYVWTSTRSGKTVRSNVHVIEVDLSNPHVKLDVMSGKNNTVANKQSVTGMVKETGAVAGINGDFFITSQEGVPMGAQVKDGALMSSPSELIGMYAFALTNDRTPVIDQFGFEGEVTAGNGQKFKLSGINQTSYMMELAGGAKQRSHLNAMYIYTSAWTAAERPNASMSATTPTEVLVQNGTVMQIAENSTLPMKPPENGYILRTHGEAAKFARENLTVGHKVDASYNLISLTTGAKKNPNIYQMMVGGHTILVNDGKAAAFSRDISGASGASATSRTSIGYSRDNKKVFLITTENSGNSSGMTFSELQRVMVTLGVWKGINLDGGGSTTMVDRPLGEFNVGLAHPTQNSGGTQQRLVANGIGVYTTAPKGDVRGVKASGPSTLFIGQQAAYSIKAYDTYYNPIDPAGMTAQWSLKDAAIGSFSNGTLTATKAGKSQINIKSGLATDQLPIEVIGRSQITQMTIDAGAASLRAGAEITVPVRVTLNDGRQMNVPAASLQWELQGFNGSVQGGKLKVDQLRDGVNTGYAIARYDGYSAVAMFSTSTAVAQKTWETFENVSYPITFTSLPVGETKGSAAVVKGLPGRENSSALQITYDFTSGTGGKFAYAALNGTGVPVDGQPLAISAAVYGDGSNNWVRAEATDAKGATHYIDLARPLDWTGWKTVKTDLTGMGITYPIRIKRIYVANPVTGQSERAAVGSVAIDDIKFDYAAASIQPDAPSIVLTVNKKEALIDGQAVRLDVAPIVLRGTTYLPLKFVADAIKGQVAWDNTAKRATFIRGNKMIDLWLGQKDIVVNGTRLSTEVAPIVRNGRTLVPVRLVTEQLGLKVHWDGAAKKITIQ
ncbi:stalk domain-containing protein [Paenibacillus abyssi]|uniref:Copper amine oxidase n=1 Tax=Paenibacillus abyssi TaxID=1340531 RepID=A0A917CKX7_9BACL|nr:stalk domain-containing protein [Paenibacillus abyssi]GGF91611.1 hypothetical protein GCM10010916_06130 [Paenibacillus abyssi]